MHDSSYFISYNLSVSISFFNFSFDNFDLVNSTSLLVKSDWYLFFSDSNAFALDSNIILFSFNSFISASILEVCILKVSLS